MHVKSRIQYSYSIELGICCKRFLHIDEGICEVVNVFLATFTTFSGIYEGICCSYIYATSKLCPGERWGCKGICEVDPSLVRRSSANIIFTVSFLFGIHGS